MTGSRDYQLKLLKEESASEDLFEDKTHQKIANTLYEVIQNGSSEGITIGLEGGWGSGKSTVVSILKNKLEKAKDTNIYFYFDAWAHEGDPLRRVFLEALIDQVGHDDKKLQDVKNKISNRKKRSWIKTNQTATGLGKLLAIAAFFIPLGVPIISATFSRTVFWQWGGEPNWQFLCGLAFTLTPIFVILCHGLRLLLSPKKLFDPGNWMFLQGESESTVTQEVSEDEERSSIEFEKYFNEILAVVFSKNKDTKLLIVVDNLDRVDAADSLKIWSTLQTFLQRRNPINKGGSYLKRIWILVPYDEDGLEKLWRDRSTERKSCNLSAISPQDKKDDTSRDCAKSFFDKCFQLRIEVPKLILTGWESFCKDNIKQALIGWNETEKKNVLDVLKQTRETVDDIPTPREIKTYVNQVGMLRLHCDKTISTAAIAYFAVQKYIRYKKNREIETHLISGMLPEDKHKPIFPAQLTAELCGILFGVSAEKGQQLLLEPEIEKALSTRDIKKIKEISEIHQNAFWTVLNLHLSKRHDFNKMLNYSFTVWNGLWESSSDKCDELVRYFKVNMDGLTSLGFPTKNSVEDSIALFSLLDTGNYDFTRIWGFIMNSLKEQMKKDDFDYSSGNKILSDLAACQKQKMPSQYTLEETPVENWIKWAAAANADKISSYVLVRPPDTIINEVASKIKAGAHIPESLYDLIEYLVNAGEEKWEPVIKALQSHIEWNQGTQSNNVFSIEIFKILTLLSATGQGILKLFDPLVKKGFLYNLASQLHKQGAVRYVALLMARCFSENLDSIQIPGIVNSAQGLEQAKNIWKTKNSENAQFIWNEVKSNSDFGFVWKLARIESNKLVGEIIRIAVKENCPEFFSYENALELFKAAIQVTDNEDAFNRELTKYFIANSQIENEIFKAIDVDLDIVTYAYELYLLLENSGNKEIAKHLIARINLITKEQWDKALKDDSCLTALAVIINEQTSALHLGDGLYEPLLAYLQKWISNSVTPSEAQQNELLELISMLTNSFKTQLKNQLANHIIEICFKGNSSAVFFLLQYINIRKIVTDGKEKIQDVLDNILRKSDIESLKIIDMILSHQDSTEFEPAIHLAEVFKVPMKGLLNAQGGIDKGLIERLASKFGVDLSEPQPNEEINENSKPQNAK